MTEVPPSAEPPINATDRNVKTAAGLLAGHITLPCSFVTGFFLIINGFYLLIVHWQFDQVSQVRARLSKQEEIVQGFLAREGERLPGSPWPVATPTPSPIPQPPFR